MREVGKGITASDYIGMSTMAHGPFQSFYRLVLVGLRITKSCTSIRFRIKAASSRFSNSSSCEYSADSGNTSFTWGKKEMERKDEHLQ